MVQHELRPAPVQLLAVEKEGVPCRFTLLHAMWQSFPAAPAISRGRGREHVHNVFHIVMYAAGRNAFSFRGERHEARPGTLVFASPGEPHEFSQQTASPSGYHNVTFALLREGEPAALPFAEYLGRLTGWALEAPAFPVHLEERPTETAAGLFERVYDALAREGGEAGFAAQRCILDLLAFFVEEVFGGGAEEETPLLRARREIERRYPERLAVAELAAIACLSEGQFGRAFKKVFGTTPIAYQRELRVRAAATLLRTGHLPCKTIARRVGFGDVYFFSRTFRKLAGMTPTAFRERYGL